MKKIILIIAFAFTMVSVNAQNYTPSNFNSSDLYKVWRGTRSPVNAIDSLFYIMVDFQTGGLQSVSVFKDSSGVSDFEDNRGHSVFKDENGYSLFVPVARVFSSLVATTGGTIVTGHKSVSFTTSSDFVGTINGVARNVSTSYSFSVTNFDVLPAISYTISAGSITIDKIY